MFCLKSSVKLILWNKLRILFVPEVIISTLGGRLAQADIRSCQQKAKDHSSVSGVGGLPLGAEKMEQQGLLEAG